MSDGPLTLTPIKRPRQSARPIGLRRPATAPRGPRLYSRPEARVAGAGEPPPGFVGPTTSRSEWICYVAFAKVLRDPPDPRQPPFFGGTNWGFQIGVLGTYTRQLGSAVVDFVYYAPRERVFIRLVTERFHEAFGPAQQAYDVIQRALLGSQGRVVDIFESHFLYADPATKDPLYSDAVLEAACVQVKNALGLIEQGNLVTLGTSRSRG
jgi:hypothetical protein